MAAIGLASYQAEIRCEWVSGSLAHGGNLVIMSGADIRPIFSSAGTVPRTAIGERWERTIVEANWEARDVTGVAGSITDITDLGAPKD